MQLWTAVNEADIGNIREGQPVTFTVDAFPNRTFKGTVSKARLDAQMTQNVVTYTVEIDADNKDRSLRPYMTANVSFQVAKRDDAMTVANVALRWSPTDIQQVAPDMRDEVIKEMSQGRQRGGGNGAGGQGGAAPSGAGRMGAGRTESSDASTQPTTMASSATSRPIRHGGANTPGQADHSHGEVWVQDGEFVRPVKVRLGVTDTINTEVVSGDLKEGDAVVIGEVTGVAANTDDAKNPFAPNFRSSRGSGMGRSTR